MRVSIVSLLCVLAVACGGAKAQPGPSNSSGPNNNPPLATISAASSAVAGAAVAFDAGASSDPDDDILKYRWSFGDGGSAGAPQVAHIFSAAGSYTTKLVVSDGRGGMAEATHVVTVSAPPSPEGTATIVVRVRAGTSPIAGAIVTRLSTGDQVTTGSDGNASIAVGTGVPQTLRVEANGYLRQTRVLELANTTSDGFIDVALQLHPGSRSMNTIENGGSLTDAFGAKLTLPENSMVDAAGKLVTGTIQVSIAPVDVVQNTAQFPGRFMGYDTSGASGLLMSWGTVAYEFSQNGQVLNLAADKQATIEIPVFAGLDTDGLPLTEGDVFPLWSLDENSGSWIQEGLGTVTTSTSSPTAFALKGEVGHFSWWNHDKFGSGYNGSGGCCIDSNFDGECDGPTMCYVRGRTNCTGTICSVRAGEAPPAWMAETVISSGNNATLLFPVAYPVRLEGFANNGLYTGRVLMTGAANENKAFQIVLQPLPEPDPTQLITLPHDANYASGDVNAYQVFEFDAAANDVIFVSVKRASGSFLEGEARLFQPNGSVPLQQATFAQQAATMTQGVNTAGRFRLEIEGTRNEPGGYQLEVRIAGQVPLITARSPSPDAVSVSRSSTVSVTFNQPIKPASVSAASFPVTGPLGAIAGTRVVNGNTITFTPTSTLPPGTKLTVSVTTGVRDNTNDFPLAGNQAWSFLTAEALGEEMPLSTSGTEPHATTLPNGQTLLTWYGANQVYAGLYEPGIGMRWIEVLDAQANNEYPESYLTLTSNEAGEAVFTWQRRHQNTNVTKVITRRYTSASGFGPEVVVFTGAPTDNQAYTSGGIDGDGNVIVVYLRNEGAERHAYARRQTANNIVSSETQIDDTNAAAGNELAAVAVAESGHAVVAWRDSTEAIAVVYHVDSDAWLATVNLGNNQSGTIDALIDRAGNAFVGWVDGSDRVHMARRPAGAATTFTTYDVGGTLSVDVNCATSFGVSRSGQAFVGFCKFPAEREIYLQRWSHPTDFAIWDAEHLLQSAPGGGGVALNVMNDGGVNVIWRLPGADVGLNGMRQRYYPVGVWPGTPVTSAVAGYPGFGYYQTMAGDENHTVILTQTSSGMGCVRLR